MSVCMVTVVVLVDGCCLFCCAIQKVTVGAFLFTVELQPVHVRKHKTFLRCCCFPVTDQFLRCRNFAFRRPIRNCRKTSS